MQQLDQVCEHLLQKKFAVEADFEGKNNFLLFVCFTFF